MEIKGKDAQFNTFSSDSVMILANDMTDWYKDKEDMIIVDVAYSCTYKGKDEQGREKMYHSAIVTHVWA